MAKLILYSPYYKAAEHNLGGYARYQATRKGVVFPKNTKLNSPATKKQKDLILSILNDFPNSKELHEYQDYIDKPTIENASEFITQALETNPQSEGIGNYARYMATRPRVEKIATHGLFSDNGTPITLSKVEQELNEYEGNVWTHIVSLRREDATRLGYDNVQAWQDLLTAKRNEIAKSMQIEPQNFRWYAAFHDEGHHPHIHILAYSVVQGEAYLSKKGIRNIKSCLAKEIFKADLYQIYEQQTAYRDTLKQSSKDIAEQIISELKQGNFHNTAIENLLFELNNKLKNTKGKKQYGYLKPELKSIVDLIVDELEKDTRIKSLYELWYSEKDKITSNYTDERLKRIPLSHNIEFKSIRNMIIQEALKLNNVIAIFDDEATDEPIIISAEEKEPEPTEEEYFELPTRKSSSKKYWKAKQLLDQKSDEYDFEKGFSLLEESAKEGNEYGQYRLGKMLFSDERCETDIEKGRYWLELSAEQGNEWAEYFLGKQYLGNKELEKNYKRAIHLLQLSAEQENKYAEYSLACQYLFSGNFQNKNGKAIELLEHSAKEFFVPAEKMLAFILLKGELIKKDETRAYKLFLHCAEKGDDKAQYALAKLLLKSDVIKKDTQGAVKWLREAIKSDNQWAKLLLGKMLFFGQGIEKNEAEGLSLLESAAQQGNTYAALILANREDYIRTNLALGTMRIFGYMGNLFQKKFGVDKSGTSIKIDKKQRRQIEEKKLAQGLRL